MIWQIMQAENTINDKLLLTLMMLAVCSHGYGATESPCANVMVAAVGKQIGLPNFSGPEQGVEGKIVDSTCKAWPKDRSKTIAAFAYDAGVQQEKSLIIALVESTGRKVVATHASSLQEDSVLVLKEGSLSLDTARYDVSSDVRAFGLRIKTSHSEGCGIDGGVGPMLYLYVQEGRSIRPVLESFDTNTWRFVDRVCRDNEIQGEATKERFYTSISMSKSSSHGFANLRVTETSDNKAKLPFRYELRYNGKNYVMDRSTKAALSRWQDGRLERRKTEN